MSTWRPAGIPARERDPRPVGDSLDRVTRAIGVPLSAVLATIFSRWEAIVGPEIAGHARPRTLREGVLTVVVEQPAWAAQLGFMTGELLRRVELAVGPGQVGEIQLRVASEPRSRGSKNPGPGGL